MSCATGNALSLYPSPKGEGLLLPFSLGRRLALSVAEGGRGMRGSHYITHLGLL